MTFYQTYILGVLGALGILESCLRNCGAIVPLCNYFLLVLRLAVAFELDSSGIHRVAIHIICLLFPVGNLCFFHAPLSENEGKIQLWSSLPPGVCVRS